ncbi:DNA-binding protein [Brachyspira catarrhinii]|uniref:DNA-binding protein n=1 Tax=Brachyspira catarrhinii TaxID=2528966 RepID=A0ABY2TU89_9SPIR|nr:DNA-binding protein [Brachyspira catarrhinii]TKZ36441.1 DNA-binding protein [Brachyspira catarrhinii]
MHFKKRFKKTIIFLLIIFSCNKNNTIERKEIEPNDNPEYAQFVDSDILIKAKLSSEDIDYYNISPTNGFIMDFSIKAESRNNINLEILDENAEKTLFKIDSKDILNYNGKIEMKDLILREGKFFFKLVSEESKNEFNYNISFNFKNEYLYKTETEINDNFQNANTIDYPKQIIYGYFFKNYNAKISIDENIKPYLKNENIIDIDFYSIENKTDIDASINIILEYKKDIDIILFDKDYNYIKKTKNKLSTDFKSGEKYYIALVFYGEKYLVDRYSLYYDFN